MIKNLLDEINKSRNACRIISFGQMEALYDIIDANKDDLDSGTKEYLIKHLKGLVANPGLKGNALNKCYKAQRLLGRSLGISEGSIEESIEEQKLFRKKIPSMSTIPMRK